MPEVLVLHCPSKHFDPEYTARLLNLLREFVDQRGLEFDEPVRERRPRTCFMSTSARTVCFDFLVAF